MKQFLKKFSGLDKRSAVNLRDDDEQNIEENTEGYEVEVEDEEAEEVENENEEKDVKEWLPEDEYEEGQLSIDVYQTPEAIIVKSTIAGVKPEDIDISINNDMLTIRGRRHMIEKIRDDQYLYRECYWGSFSRSIILPVEIEPEKIDALLENGVLTVTLPKAKSAKQISIKVKER